MNLQPHWAAKVAAALVTAVALVACVWITGLLSPNVFVHGAAAAAATAALGGVILLLTRTRPDLRRPALISLCATLAVVLAIGAWSARPHTVNEQVVTAADSPAGTDAAEEGEANSLVVSGSFESLAHETRGTARIIQLPDGSQKLTLQDFATDPGPDLFIYLVAGNPTGDDDVTEFLSLGRLKGNKGTQQYDVPEEFESGRHRYVYIWCRAFTVGFGRAPLDA